MSVKHRGTHPSTIFISLEELKFVFTCHDDMQCTLSLLRCQQQSCWHLQQGKTCRWQPQPWTVCEPAPCYPVVKIAATSFIKAILTSTKSSRFHNRFFFLFYLGRNKEVFLLHLCSALTQVHQKCTKETTENIWFHRWGNILPISSYLYSMCWKNVD